MKWLRRGPRTPPWLIVGLGNPGARYERNRHNIGFLVVDLLAERHGVAVDRKRPYAFVGEGNATALSGDGAARVVLAKPRTFMNASGDAVVPLAQGHRVPKRQIVVIYDELDLPLGKVRIRARGSAGGHNGMKSIIATMGTDAITRIRVGIGRSEGTEGAVSRVLGDFTADEQELIMPALANAADAVDWIVKEGVESAMNEFNSG